MRIFRARTVRSSSIFISFIAVNVMLLMLLLLHSRSMPAGPKAIVSSSAAMVKELRLTDLCLFTEARYTRHPAMADLHSAFQDHPLALEHFPSGSLMAPPAHLTGDYAPSR